jgi:hypothetical protein
MPGSFGLGKQNYKKWTEISEKFAIKSKLRFFLQYDLMRTGKFIDMK